jgi:uncharacterized protein with PIN domain
MRRPDQPIRFMADVMLGRLARWLRILGYDTAYEKVMDDRDLIERVLAEDRWLLTRDGHMVQRKVLRGRHTLIESDDLENQLRQLHRDLKIDLAMSHLRGHRCADCNMLLASISHEEAVPLVPSFVAQQHRVFLRCPRCGRVFWPGTHWDDLFKRLAAIKETGPGDRL